MRTCAGVVLLAACAVAITRDQFYPHGPVLDQRLPKGRDIPSPEVFLKVPVIFYGETYDNIFVNNFGVLTFRANIPSFINTEFPLPYPSIAGFYTNIDTTEEGAVYYRETDEPHIVSKAEESVQNNFHDYQDFKPTSVFIATWLEVPYASEIRDRKNSFQIAIISNGTESFVELLYPEREIQWIQRETPPTNEPDAKAQAGFVAEDGRVFTLRGSGSHQIRNIITWTNTHESGKYVYRIGNITPDGNIANPDQYDQNEVEVEEESKTCSLSGPSVCHIKARCVDYQAGICCQCSEGYYGNGKSCIKNDVPLRVHGKLNGILNDIHLNDVNIQAYVVVADGRAYTALALAPPVLGRSLLLLNVLGGIVGWLFAKPSGSAKNGYQLTGAVFNHTTDIWFPLTNDRVTIHQEYLGHDVFDQITIESDVRGTVPVIMSGTKLQQLEYEEHYTIVEPGLVRSEATRILVNKETGERYEQRISQSISYVPCRYAPTSLESTFTVMASKNYLGYETTANIVRYGTSNKIVPVGQEDPCARGQETCDIHSVCVAQGDSFACVCKSGYTNIYQEGASTCTDIDECSSGTHNCDTNANCFNHDGGFQCRCAEGFDGNGITCTPRSRCHEIKCGPNAQCIGSEEGPFCICASGYTGDGSSCWEIGEIECPHTCSKYGFCRGTQCECLPGYAGDGYNCEWVGQTTTSSDSLINQGNGVTHKEHSRCIDIRCGDHAQCIESEMGPFCHCAPGYTGDGSTCWEIRENECPLCSMYGFCRGTECECLPGYDGDGYNCNWIGHTTPSDSLINPGNGATHKKSSRCIDIRCGDHAQCIESEMGPFCLCAPGYTGDGSTCWEIRENECPLCSMYGFCRGTQCECLPGYAGDGYNCDWIDHTTSSDSLVYPQYGEHSSSPASNIKDVSQYPDQEPRYYVSEEPYDVETSSVSETPYISETTSDLGVSSNAPANEAEYNETYVLPNCNIQGCSCPQGYSNYRDESNNELCRDDGYSNPPNEDVGSSIGCDADTDCPPNAICSFSSEEENEYSGHCVCLEGYEGDGYQCLERTGPSCSCGLNAHCIETVASEFICMCDGGYVGDGYHCRPSFSCTNNSDCEYNAECRPNAVTNELICQCIEGYVKDQSDACIPDGLCNGAFCTRYASCLYDDNLNLNYCHCDDGYDGDGIIQCTPAGRTCDVTHDCHYDALCLPLDSSYQCVCRDGYIGDGYSCTQEQTCRTNPYLCSPQASCLKRSDGFVCECNSGYSGNGTHCDLNPRLSGNFLVLSEGATIYRVPFQMTPRDYATPVSSSIDQIAVGVDVDCVAGKIYWGDVVGNTIKRVSYDGSGLEPFLRKGVISPEGVSVDWSARNIFWTDSKKLTIEVANVDTKVRKVLFAVEGISNPRGIVVHPQKGKIFWTDWKRANPKIEWASMDGSQRGVFLDKNDVTLPNSLAIDWERDRLCYADAGLLSIKCVGIETLERDTIAASCSHPFSLAINGNKLYWSDWKTLKIETADVITQLRGQLPMAISSRPYGLAVAPSQCPALNNVCTNHNGGCASNQLCLPSGRGRTCVDGDETYQEL